MLLLLREDGPRHMAALRALPLDVLQTPSVGAPAAGWGHLGSYLVPPHLPFWLTEELWTDGRLGRAVDGLALRFLQNISLTQPCF